MDPKTRLEEKRNVPNWVQKLLSYDVELTKRFVSFSLNFVPVRSIKTHCLFLEYSCHGAIWLPLVLASCWILDKPKYYQTQINLLVALFIDIVVTAVVKAYTRRRRPTLNDESRFTFGPDKFSFPSGHASRAFMIFYFFVVLDPVWMIFWPSLLAWATCVAFSRLLLYRHHILDVAAGALFGILEGILVGLLWLNYDTSAWFISWLSDDKLPGDE